MNHYEIGRHTPDYTTLKRIADVLKVPTAYFYTEEDILAEIIKAISDLNFEQKNNILIKLRSG